ncbi:MAG: hypothetical protein AABZ06_13575, partial [Bdellovibrionota bacterium]
MTPIIRPTVSATFLERVNTSPNKIAFYYKSIDPTNPRPEHEWVKITFGEFFAECRLVSFGMTAEVISTGDKLAI